MSKLYLEAKKQLLDNFVNYTQVMLMRLMSKIEYFTMPKGTKFSSGAKKLISLKEKGRED